MTEPEPPAPRHDDPARTPPQLPAPALEARMGGVAAPRYRVGEVLGVGGIGRVLLVADANLRREVAIKTPLPSQAGDPVAIETFVAEARITASLEHPGIAPVHDLDLSADGQVYYAMRRVRGRSLGALIGEALETGIRPVGIATTNDIVTLVLKVCDALAYAHSRDVVHRDLKPDNIMLGDFGEVLVMDWGASSSPAHGPGRPGSGNFGTPAFMSPEQARQEPIDPRSDVYSLGATLFQVLLLRFPLEAADAETMLARKRRGELDPPRPGETDARTRPLAAIALRAMAAAPADRYQSVAAFAADLRSYQAGQAMVAYRGSPAERLARWLRRWWRPLATAAACAATLGVAVWLVWGERLKQVATWGTPIVSEDFADGGWTSRWSVDPDPAFAVQGGRLVSTAATGAFLRSRRPFTGPVAIAYDGEMTPGSRPCDLSVAWWDGVADPPGRGAPSEGWLLQIGAFDNHFCTLIRCHAGRQTQVARHPLRLESGRVYHLRAEFDGTRIAISVDGSEVLVYDDIFPVRPGWLGIYAYYPGKAFDDIRVYAKGVPERLSPVALGDDDAQDGNYQRAVERYQRVITSHPTGPLADEAWYKIGHCRLAAGDAVGAWQAWDRVRAAPFADRVAVHRLDRLFDAGQHDELLRRLPEVVALSAACRVQSEAQWSYWAESLPPPRSDAERAVVERYLETRRRLFPGSGSSLTAYGRTLNRMQQWERTLAECGEDPLSAGDAFQSLGRIEEAMARYGHMDWSDASMRCQIGDLEGAAARNDGQTRAWPLGKLGRLAEARRANVGVNWETMVAGAEWAQLLALPDAQRGNGGELACLALGRSEDAVSGAYRAKPSPSRYALLLLGRQAEAERLDLDGVRNLDALRLIAALASGDRDRAAALRAQLAREPIDWLVENAWFARLVLLPHLAWRDGDPAAWTAALAEAQAVRARAGQRLWHLAAYIDGRIDAKAMLAQPYRSEAEAWMRLGDAIRAERRGDPPAAKAAYLSFQALPIERRLLDGYRLDPQIERFVAWRLQDLAGR